MSSKDELLVRLRELLGEGGVISGDDLQHRDHGWNKIRNLPLAVVRPRSTGEVAAVLAACHAAGQAVVAQGGKTNMSDASSTPGGEIALSMERMSGVEAVDTVARTMTVKAGTPLQVVQEAAEELGLMFPLDLGARGSATIGGNIATNAGGNRVIRYGMTRNHVLGLEAVLADGTVIPAMHSVVKNNTGYDLKHWFIGSEGTLGIVTRAVLRLSPLPTSRNTALLAVRDFATVASLLTALERDFGGQLAAFEVMWNSYYSLATDMAMPTGKASPLDRDHPYYVLVETLGGDQDADAALFETVLQKVFEAGHLDDAVLARSVAERDKLWAIRDNIESLFQLWPIFTFDVSLAIPHMEAYLATVEKRVSEQWPEGRLVTFGHLGDGNLHLIVVPGTDQPGDHERADAIVYGELAPINGVISAEHGIGLERKAWLSCSRSPTEIAMMKAIKQSLDPTGILNPGKVFDL